MRAAAGLGGGSAFAFTVGVAVPATIRLMFGVMGCILYRVQ